MHFSLTIDTYNGGMRTAADVAAALDEVASKLDGLSGLDSIVSEGSIRDVNGNTVGHWTIAQHRAALVSLIGDAAHGDPGEADE